MRSIILSLAFISIISCLSAQTGTINEYIKPGDLEEWVSYLSSDDMKGRANGSDEMRSAAMWLAGRFKEFGIQEFKDYPGYIQEYSFSRRSSSVNERNIIGFVEGTDPELKDEYIIVTAHFDHIGIRMGAAGDSIYNGADDNAAGTSTLLGVAKALQMSAKKPGRTLVFAAVSGEEMGLHGSRYLANNSPVPPGRIYTNINFEMTGHSEELGRGNYYMTGCSYSTLDDLVIQFGKGGDITLIDTLAIADRLFFMSDNLSFSRLKQEDDIMYGIPSGTFVTSTFAPHVHSPSDEIDLFDLENMADLVNYFSEMVLWLSHCREEIVWTDSRFRKLDGQK
jgi:Zn-dependent M28 family amino/carboxypeptidase